MNVDERWAKLFGERCPDFEKDCPACEAWSIIDFYKKAANDLIHAAQRPYEVRDQLLAENAKLRAVVEVVKECAWDDVGILTATKILLRRALHDLEHKSLDEGGVG